MAAETGNMAGALSDNERNKLMFQATVAFEVERYDDMVEFMKKVATSSIITNDEKKLFRIAHQKKLDVRSESLKKIEKMMEISYEQGQQVKVSLLTDYAKRVFQEIESVCSTTIEFINVNLLNASTETKVFYNTMKGDLYRRLLKYIKTNKIHENALKSYQQAKNLSETLSWMDVNKMEIYHKIAFFYCNYEHKNEEALHLLKEKIDGVDKEFSKNKTSLTVDQKLLLEVSKELHSKLLALETMTISQALQTPQLLDSGKSESSDMFKEFEESTDQKLMLSDSEFFNF